MYRAVDLSSRSLIYIYINIYIRISKYLYIFNGKRKPKWFSLIRLPFAHCANGSYPFTNRVKGLNGLAHLCIKHTVTQSQGRQRKLTKQSDTHCILYTQSAQQSGRNQSARQAVRHAGYSQSYSSRGNQLKTRHAVIQAPDCQTFRQHTVHAAIQAGRILPNKWPGRQHAVNHEAARLPSNHVGIEKTYLVLHNCCHRMIWNSHN
jgi:hypothetical protein